MKRVTEKQRSSKRCFVCGLKNVAGLRAEFYGLESGEIVGVFTPRDEHQSYPNRLHGGVAAAILDETMGRAIMLRQGEAVWGVTSSLEVRYRRPVPLETELRVRGRVEEEDEAGFVGAAELLLPNGKVAVEARGTYVKLSLDAITDFDFEAEEWRVVAAAHDPRELDV